MRRKCIFLFMFVLFLLIVPSKVHGQTFYLGYGKYEYSEEVVEERLDLEVEKIFKDGKEVYRYRDREYLILPDKIVVYHRFFNIKDEMITNVSLEDFQIIEDYDLETMNHCTSSIHIQYKGTKIDKMVYIEIENYIKVPNEIIIKDNTFNIWDYIETDVEPKEDIKIIGDYDLTKNGRYELLITYCNVEEKTTLVVDIEESQEKIDTPIEDVKNEILERQEKAVLEELVSVEAIPDKRQFNERDEVEISTKEVRDQKQEPCCSTPKSKVVCNLKKQENNLFYSISYVFYGVVIILLSIIVVRKK